MQNPLRRPRGNQDAEAQTRPRNEGGMSVTVQGHLVAMSGEFVGTIMFLYFAFAATQIANSLSPAGQPSIDQLLFISLAFGFSLAVTAWVFYRISGGLFNPAVCLHVTLIAHERVMLMIIPGHVRNGHYWNTASCPWSIALLPSDPRRHGCCCACKVHVPRPFGSRDGFVEWHFDCPGLVHRDVLDRRAGLHGLDVGGREIQGDFHSPCGYWSCPVCCRTCRYVILFTCPDLSSD